MGDVETVNRVFQAYVAGALIVTKAVLKLTLNMNRHIIKMQRGVEQWQLVGLITRRSLVQIQPPLPNLF